MIARKTFWELWPLLLIYFLVMQVLLVPVISLWPDLYADLQRSVTFRHVMSAAEFMKRWHTGITTSDEDVAYRNWMAIHVFFKGVNICGVAGAVLMGTGLIARERENQTLEFLMARPVSRSWILWSKFWVVSLLLAVPIFLTTWSTIPLSATIGLKLGFGYLTLGAFHASVFVLMLLSLTTLCSVIFRSQMHTAAAVGTFVVVNVVVYFIQKLRVASLFRLSDFDIYSPIMLSNTHFSTLFWNCTVWMLLAAALLYAAADWQFRRADL